MAKCMDQQVSSWKDKAFFQQLCVLEADIPGPTTIETAHIGNVLLTATALLCWASCIEPSFHGQSSLKTNNSQPFIVVVVIKPHTLKPCLLTFFISHYISYKEHQFPKKLNILQQNITSKKLKIPEKSSHTGLILFSIQTVTSSVWRAF